MTDFETDKAIAASGIILPEMQEHWLVWMRGLDDGGDRWGQVTIGLPFLVLHSDTKHSWSDPYLFPAFSKCLELCLATIEANGYIWEWKYGSAKYPTKNKMFYYSQTLNGTLRTGHCKHPLEALIFIADLITAKEKREETK